MNAIEVNHLTRKFKDFKAVDDISFTIPQGEIFGLLGPNGAGKTTTIRILCGIMLPTSGAVNVLGYDVRLHPNEVKSRIGYMSQKFSLYNDLTPAENIMFYSSIYDVPKHERVERTQELIKRSGLTDHQKQLTRSLSGAWRQRLALACAIVHRPQMLFLDEAEYCNTIGMMYQGKMMALDNPEDMKNNLPGVLVQLDCSDPAKAVEELAALPGVLNASIHGALVHLTLDDQKAENGVKKELTKAGITIRNWEIIQPSLEDVFLQMVSERLSSEPAQNMFSQEGD